MAPGAVPGKCWENFQGFDREKRMVSGDPSAKAQDKARNQSIDPSGFQEMPKEGYSLAETLRGAVARTWITMVQGCHSRV